MPDTTTSEEATTKATVACPACDRYFDSEEDAAGHWIRDHPGAVA